MGAHASLASRTAIALVAICGALAGCCCLSGDGRNAAGLAVSPTALQFAMSGGSRALIIRNTGGHMLSWAAIGDRSWITLSASEGSTVAGAESALTVTVERDDNLTETRTGTVTITSNGGEATVQVRQAGRLILDEGLESAICERLRRATGELTVADLASMTGHLYASHREIRDLAGIELCTGLSSIDLSYNLIEDLRPLSGLTNLTSLNLRANEVEDIGPLVANTGLADGDVVDVSCNPLNPQTRRRYLEALRDRGVAVINDLFESEGLEAAVREALGQPTGDLTAEDLATLTGHLDASDREIRDLEGLQYCTGLTSLDLSDNAIIYLECLAPLTNLTNLDLSGNSIYDLEYLAPLTNLTSLDLSDNVYSCSEWDAEWDYYTGNTSWYGIQDLYPLSRLTRLTTLDLSGNLIEDLTPLARLTNLEHLDLSGNWHENLENWRPVIVGGVKDLSPLSGLTSLVLLDVSDNPSLFDVSPLVANVGLGAGDEVNLADTMLASRPTEQAISDVAALRARGVSVIGLGPPAW